MIAAGLAGAALFLGACAGSELKTLPAQAPSLATQGMPLVRDRIRVGFNPIGVAVTEDGAYIYVANNGSNSVSKIEAATRQVVSTIQLAVSPAWLALAPRRGLVLVTSRDAQALILLDRQGNYQVASIDLPYSPEQVVVDAAETLAYLSYPRAPFVAVFDLEKRRIRQNIALTDPSVGLALTPDQKYLYVTTSGTTGYNLQVIGTAEQTVVARTNVGSAPSTIAMDPGGNYAYVANHDSEDLTMVNIPTHHAVLTIPIGQSPMDVKVAPSGRYLFVSGDQNSLLLLDTAEHRVIDHLDLDVSPWGMAFAPDGKTLYVANYQLGGSRTYNASRPDLTLGTGAAQRVNNNTLLAVDTGRYQ
jgi:YVTN family beta-propeller protein